MFISRLHSAVYNLIRGWVRKFCHRCYNFVNTHDRLLFYPLIERATFLLYNDAKIMHERNKYLNILIRSRDLECTLVFLSAMPRSATVAIIYALRLLSLHL